MKKLLELRQQKSDLTQQMRSLLTKGLPAVMNAVTVISEAVASMPCLATSIGLRTRTARNPANG
ncbi:hypothetical protein XBKQ1_440008 [Xenorhabdus bovienii str. kraussei Quebec]|uniref:Uncharacterized protein n=1 Tax=Xenorhabdus bovienii str. kraussei Quebec TaxID=1398203 RepID=A0A077PNP0_XENBV|nr:hypothetical protein XBKQ1_440008 [Xenorhabdus bovienii str. kraussei Quebec]